MITAIATETTEKTEKKHYSPEEYLALEAESEIKHEYRNGEIVERDASTTTHNKLTGKLAFCLLQSLRDKSYEIYVNDVRLWIPEANKYTYPDVMIVQGQPVYTDDSQTMITNPVVIAEVLSKSTQGYDQGEKFDDYRTLPSFCEYLLIDQYEYYVKHFAKTPEGKWLLTDIRGADGAIALESLQFNLSLADLYKGIEFTAK